MKLVDPNGLSTTTGWRTWNAALVTREFLFTDRSIKDKRIVDISSGNGVLAIALTQQGGLVYATECDLCIELLKANISNNFPSKENTFPHVVTLNWDEGITSLANLVPLASLDIVCMSDLLFIAIRDNIEHALLNVCLAITPTSSCELIFCFEERIIERERAFMSKLGEYFHIDEVEISDSMLEACSRDESGAEEETNGFTDIFYEPPPMKLYSCKRI